MYRRIGLSLRLYAKTVNTSSTNHFADVNAFYQNDNVRVLQQRLQYLALIILCA